MVFDEQVRADFDLARLKAAWRHVVSRIAGRRNELLRFEEVRRQLHAQGQHYAGFRPVPLDAIVGSIGRYRDFDSAFLPRQSQTRGRWLNIDRAHYEELTLVGAFHHTPALIRRAVELLESRAIDPEPLVTHRMGLAQVKEALAMMERGETMKVLVDPER